MQLNKSIITCLFTLFITFCNAQQTIKDVDITGLWRGTMYNDTTKQALKYEIAISKEGKNFSGFSYTFFIYEDKVYTALKKLKLKIADNKLIVIDDGLIAHNFPIAPAKGVKMMSVLNLTRVDSLLTLQGLFETNRTKEYSVLTGSVNVQRKNDFYVQSALLPHLEELGLAKNLSFLQTQNEPQLAALNNNKIEIEKPKQEQKIFNKKIAQKTQIQTAVKPQATLPVNILPAADVANRKVEVIQNVNFKSDSLELTLYDNGEVDGDTVSVLLNGNVIMPKVGLTTTAVRKKISTANINDSLQLIMYAETLGSLPPNTGLLIVYDGADRYEIRFSGDMQKSSAIVFRRKK